MKRIVIFASGSGSNAERIIQHFHENDEVSVRAVLTNKRDAYVIDRCNKLGINALYFNRSSFRQSDLVLNILKGIQTDLIVLAGFLWKIPENIIDAYQGKIVNIHPALLPKYGGKGMYGMKVHQAVKENGEKETGISIHHVNQEYDEGDIIYQASVALDPDDTIEEIADKVHQLEYEHYPRIIEELLQQ